VIRLIFILFYFYTTLAYATITTEQFHIPLEGMNIVINNPVGSVSVMESKKGETRTLISVEKEVEGWLSNKVNAALNLIRVKKEIFKKRIVISVYFPDNCLSLFLSNCEVRLQVKLPKKAVSKNDISIFVKKGKINLNRVESRSVIARVEKGLIIFNELKAQQQIKAVVIEGRIQATIDGTTAISAEVAAGKLIIGEKASGGFNLSTSISPPEIKTTASFKVSKGRLHLRYIGSVLEERKQRR